MDYVELMNTTCPSHIAAEARSMGADALAGDTLWELAPGIDPECGNNLLGHLAEQVGPDASDVFLSAYFTAATRLSGTLTTDVRQVIAQAASRVDIEDRPDVALTYFTALTVLNLDIRDALATRMIGPLTGGDPRSVAWQYQLYLIALDTPKAIDAAADHIALIQNGNDATNLLRSLATIRKPGVRDVLATYRKDDRRADGPDGPGAKISETVSILIDAQTWSE